MLRAGEKLGCCPLRKGVYGGTTVPSEKRETIETEGEAVGGSNLAKSEGRW